MTEEVKKPFDWNNLNILSLLSIIFSVTGFHVPGIVLGHIALVQIKRSGQSGRGLAIAGLVLGYAAFALAIIAFSIFFLWAILEAGRGMHYGGWMGPMGDRWA